jgi:serine/threonine protein kinase
VIKRPNLSFQADLNYDKFLRRFKREGEALANVQIPNIVRILDFLEIDHMPCLVMNFVNGETLEEYVCHRGCMPESDALLLFQTLTTALEALHQRNIIHCDIHPGNIMVQLDGEPMLIDFGSVKLLYPTTSTVTTTYNEDYSPYEQGHQSDDDFVAKPNWDVYSLAASMFFAVTGKKPVSAISRKIHGDTLRSPKKIKPDLSNRLDKMIMNGMVLEGSERPKSIVEWKYSLNNNILKLVEKLFFQLRGLCLIALAYLSSGVLVGSYVTTKDNNSFYSSVLVAIGGSVGSSFIAASAVKNKADSQKISISISTIAFLLFAYVLGGILSFTLIGALAGSILFTFTRYPSKKDSLTWLITFIFIGALFIGGITGYIMGGSIPQVLLFCVLTSISLFSMITGYHFSRTALPKSREDIQILLEYLTLSMISVFIGIILGLVLKFRGIINFP